MKLVSVAIALMVMVVMVLAQGPPSGDEYTMKMFVLTFDIKSTNTFMSTYLHVPYQQFAKAKELGDIQFDCTMGGGFAAVEIPGAPTADDLEACDGDIDCRNNLARKLHGLKYQVVFLSSEASLKGPKCSLEKLESPISNSIITLQSVDKVSNYSNKHCVEHIKTGGVNFNCLSSDVAVVAKCKACTTPKMNAIAASTLVAALIVTLALFF